MHHHVMAKYGNDPCDTCELLVLLVCRRLQLCLRGRGLPIPDKHIHHYQTAGAHHRYPFRHPAEEHYSQTPPPALSA